MKLSAISTACAAILLSTAALASNVTPPTVNQVGAKVMPAKIAPILNTPFYIPQLQRPEFPSRTVDITAKGATQSTPITEIVNKTIAEVSAQGGGTVVIPQGNWTSARIMLKSNVNLHIAEGAVIEFSGKVEDYQPAVFTRVEGIEMMAPGAFIYANGQHNIAVTGAGTIYGPTADAPIRKLKGGNAVVEKYIDHNLPIAKRLYDGMDGRVIYQPKMISPINCTNVLIEGITVERSITWNVVPIYCDSVIIRGVTVNSPGVPSGDGIDIESTTNVLIEYCTLNNGDDCFTIKSGRAEDGERVNRPSENIVIRYCLSQEGHGAITCGSETAGVVRNVYAHDCVFDGTDRGIRFKTRRNRGGGIEGIFYERIRMIGVKEVFTWDLLGTAFYMGELAARYPERPVDKLTPVVKDIRVKNLVVESSQYFINATCIPEVALRNVVIDGGDVNCNQIIRNFVDITDFTVRNIAIRSKDNVLKMNDASDVTFDNIKFEVPDNKLTLEVEGQKSGGIRFIHIDPRNPFVEYVGKTLIIPVK